MRLKLSKEGDINFPAKAFVSELCKSYLFTKLLKKYIPKQKVIVSENTESNLTLMMYISLVFTLFFPIVFADPIRYFYTEYFISFLIENLPNGIINKLIEIGL